MVASENRGPSRRRSFRTRRRRLLGARAGGCRRHQRVVRCHRRRGPHALLSFRCPPSGRVGPSRGLVSRDARPAWAVRIVVRAGGKRAWSPRSSRERVRTRAGGGPQRAWRASKDDGSDSRVVRARGSSGSALWPLTEPDDDTRGTESASVEEAKPERRAGSLGAPFVWACSTMNSRVVEKHLLADLLLRRGPCRLGSVEDSATWRSIPQIPSPTRSPPTGRSSRRAEIRSRPQRPVGSTASRLRRRRARWTVHPTDAGCVRHLRIAVLRSESLP